MVAFAEDKKKKSVDTSEQSQSGGNGHEVYTPDQAFADLCQKASYLKDDPHFKLIQDAYKYSLLKHSGQSRKSGEPYILHPIAVAEILAHLRVDSHSLISALLHDVVEDTDATVEEIKEKFGKTVAELVDGLTKIGKIKFRSNQERLAENFRKMVLAMAKDLRVILIKLADRLHNMRTLDSMPPDKKQRIAQETLDIYAPLAGRLGIYGVKSELEDLCLKITKYTIYKEIAQNIAAKKKERESYIAEVKQILEEELKKYGFKEAIVYGRPKHFFSIYRKMVDRQLAFEDIHDLFAFRIIVPTVKDCYEALGIVHSMWKPMPGRFKDYIAMPKANMYQSLHTTVIRPNGAPAEIQIRTPEMNTVCEYGVAAHWSYKEKKGQLNKTDLNNFTWLRQMMELQHDVQDPSEFLAAVKVDLFDEEIFVFTPKGDVIQLCKDATALDFAFSVHSDIGLHTIGSKVNGRITPLRSKLKSGDIIEVFTSTHQTPSKDWLNFVQTAKARNKIRSFLRSEQRETSKKLGRELLEAELHKKSISLENIIETHKTDQISRHAKESNFDDILIAIGYGKIDPQELSDKAFPTPASIKEKKEAQEAYSSNSSVQKYGAVERSTSGVLVSGLKNILVTFGRCCNPLPGEDIFGFITRGRGVSIHKINCARALDLDPARRVDVSWVNTVHEPMYHTAYLRVITQERQGVLADVTVAISSSHVNIKKAQVTISADLKGVLDFELSLQNLAQLQDVIDKVECIKDVVLVERRNVKTKQVTKKKVKKKKL